MKKMVVLMLLASLLFTGCAAGRTQEDAVKEIGKLGIKMEARNLAVAVRDGDTNMLHLFLDAKFADQSTLDSLLRTAALGRTLAASTSMELLIDHGADINTVDRLQCTPLMIVLLEPSQTMDKFNDKQRMARMLVDKGADLTMRNTSGRTAIDIARDKGYKDLVTYMESKK